MEIKNSELLIQELISFMAPYRKQGICVAFSGGVDSCVVLKAACIANEGNDKPVLAITFETKLHPHSDITEAKELAEIMGAKHYTITVDEFADPQITKNPVNRCYLCKKLLFQTMTKTAHDLGYLGLFDGSNMDDTKEYRPGLAALEELAITSPLIELQVTKSSVRKMASILGLSTASKPSAPCLATRLPYDTSFDYELLAKINQGEDYLKELGHYNVRLRYHHPIVRIEVDKSEIADILNHSDKIVSYLKDLGFAYITLDLEGFRSGSMDIFVTK